MQWNLSLAVLCVGLLGGAFAFVIGGIIYRITQVLKQKSIDKSGAQLRPSPNNGVFLDTSVTRRYMRMDVPDTNEED
jgi:hypothetical protein